MMKLDAVTLAVMNNRMAAIADEMGVVLGQTGFSPNIKERRDFSCALFDGRGELVAQAAHIPVHLGSTPLGHVTRIDEQATHVRVVDQVADDDLEPSPFAVVPTEPGLERTGCAQRAPAHLVESANDALLVVVVASIAMMVSGTFGR